MIRNPSATSASRLPPAATAAETGWRASAAADTRNDTPLTTKAGPVPAKATRASASGARAIWETTAAGQMAELAATTWSRPTRVGSTLAAAGLKDTVPTDSAKAAA